MPASVPFASVAVPLLHHHSLASNISTTCLKQGQTAVKRKSAALPHACAPPFVRRRPQSHRQLFPKQQSTPASAFVPVVLKPATSVGTFVVLTREVSALTPIAPAGTLPPHPPTRRAYNHTVDKNKCSQCSQPRSKESGHRQYYGYIYCPQNAGMPVDQWMKDMWKKKGNKTLVKNQCQLYNLYSSRVVVYNFLMFCIHSVISLCYK